MALGTDRKVIEDTGSDVVRLSRLELNKVMDAMEQLVDDLENATDFANMQTRMTNDVQPLIALLRKLIATHERPLPQEPQSPPAP